MIAKQTQAKTTSITKSNAEFAGMVPAQKRIAIAKDVIAQLNTAVEERAITVVCDLYFELQDVEGTVQVGDQLQSLIAQAKAPCQVCAKGAIFAVKVLNYNDYKIRHEDSLPAGCLKSLSVDEDSMRRNLKGIFSGVQLDLIENAFTKDMVNGSFDAPKYVRAAAMYPGIGNAENRLRLIMENIIENGGTFVVPRCMTLEMRNFALLNGWFI